MRLNSVSTEPDLYLRIKKEREELRNRLNRYKHIILMNGNKPPVNECFLDLLGDIRKRDQTVKQLKKLRGS